MAALEADGRYEDAETLKAWIEPIARAVDAELLVSDDVDGFKTVADHLGLDHQFCKSHVKRNTETLMEGSTQKVNLREIY